jgi:hypothetical protein
MAENYGDALAQEIAKRVGPPVDTYSDLALISADSKPHGQRRLVLDTMSEYVYDINADAWVAPGSGGSGPLVWAEWTDPVAADAAGLKAATATVASPVTVLAAALLAPGKAALLAYPRNVTFTTAGVTPSDAPATATITGTDVDDAVLVETVNLAQTATIAAGVKAFKTIVSIAYPAADGTGATVAIGFGAVFGLPTMPEVRAGAVVVNKEIANGAIVTNGVFVVPATSPPYGTYAPNSAPDGSKDYAVQYEQDNA